MKDLLTTLIALTLLATSAGAQSPLSLSQAIETGLANNFQIQIAEMQRDIAANNDDWAVAGRYPSINLVVNSNNSYRNQSNPAGPLTKVNSISPSLAPGIEANWVLFDGYRVRYTKNLLEQQARLSEGNIKLAVENSIQSIINAYYLALVQKEQLDVVQEVLALSRDRVAYQELRKEFGQASTFDILQTKDAYLNDSTNYVLQLNTFETALRNLNRSMGVDDLSTQYLLTDKLQYDVSDYAIDDLQQRMLANNHQLQNELANRELAAINTRIQESDLKPSLSLQAGTNYNVGISFGEQTLEFGANISTRSLPEVAAKTFTGFVNFNATYPIFDGGVRQKRIENAKTEEIIAQAGISDLKRTLNSQLANTLATYNTQKRLVDVTTQLVDNARRNLEIAEERFRGGLINSFDYRTIQLGYINASQQRLTALFNLKNTETELVRLIGGLVR
ncbi:MAG: TolC family protein [Phaeodactylibacter sp.]|nr:TolC family protein [Phaeodactylibacter sp.]MCB9299567.1 TolC family protein [Lewinellaceae bacterium]